MTKLYEHLSKEIGSTFNLRVGDTEKELTLGRFSFGLMIKYEEEGLSMEDIVNNLQKSPATFGTRLGWDLLVEKDEFNNDLALFRECLKVSDFATFGEAIYKTLNDSRPIVKKPVGASKKK